VSRRPVASRLLMNSVPEYVEVSDRVRGSAAELPSVAGDAAVTRRGTTDSAGRARSAAKGGFMATAKHGRRLVPVRVRRVVPALVLAAGLAVGGCAFDPSQVPVPGSSVAGSTYPLR